MITAKFGSKQFEVSSKRIYTPKGVSISETLDIDEKEVSGKKPTVTIKGIELQTLDFEVKLDSRFVDVVTELKFWKNTLLNKKSQIFYLGEHPIGKFFLTKYNVNNITINKDGKYTGAAISLSFKEDGKYANSNKIVYAITKKAAAVKKSSTTSKTTNIRKGTVIKPKSGVRWYYTADGALKKSGKSGKAYQRNMTVTYTYSKNGKIVCVNPQGLGWLKVEDVTVITNPKSNKLPTVTVK